MVVITTSCPWVPVSRDPASQIGIVYVILCYSVLFFGTASTLTTVHVHVHRSSCYKIIASLKKLFSLSFFLLCVCVQNVQIQRREFCGPIWPVNQKPQNENVRQRGCGGAKMTNLSLLYQSNTTFPTTCLMQPKANDETQK